MAPPLKLSTVSKVDLESRFCSTFFIVLLWAMYETTCGWEISKDVLEALLTSVNFVQTRSSRHLGSREWLLYLGRQRSIRHAALGNIGITVSPAKFARI